MKEFEQFYKFGMAHREPGMVHKIGLSGATLTDEERDYLADCVFHYIKAAKGGKAPSLLDVYISAFLAGVGYAGAYLGPGSET